jgi:ABC-type sugar transport system permease subunit
MVLNMFEVVFALTQGGPEYSSQTLMLTLYQRAFQSAQYGDGSAMAVVISILTIGIAAAQVKAIRGLE